MRTVLYDSHRALKAQFTDFGGWEMPLHYAGILEEHKAVRSHLGIFDVSHMGRIAIEGPQAEAFVDYISANNMLRKKNFAATYTPLCAANGMTVDDTIIYKIDETHYFMIANASNRVKDLAHLEQYGQKFNVSILPRYNDEGILAVQGPKAKDLMSSIFPRSQQLEKPMQFMEVIDQEMSFILSSTGYSGSGGFEIYAPKSLIPALWELLLQRGAPQGIMPIGLGARNTLRLEMGYALYGHELSDSIAPTESVARWSVKLSKDDFLGKSALLALEKAPTKRSAYGVMLLQPGIARDDYLLFHEGEAIGKVTSGGYSPTLDKSIALVLSQRVLTPGAHVEVQIRGRLCVGEVVELPFVRITESFD